MLLLIWLAVLVAALVLYFKKVYSVFSKCGIKHPTPIPILGNGLAVLLGREHVVDNLTRIYNMFPEESMFKNQQSFDFRACYLIYAWKKRALNVSELNTFAYEHNSLHMWIRGYFYILLSAQQKGSRVTNLFCTTSIHKRFKDNYEFFGQYEFMRPLITITDIELIKQITVKDFEYFLDHRTMVDGTIDPLFGRNLFSLKGQEWKDMRSTLSPAFTSSKMKLMLPLIVEVGNRTVESLKKQIKESQDNYLDIDAKYLTTRYANDVIASCAFGLNVDSVAEENNEFFQMGKLITNFGLSAFLKFFIFIYFPKLTKIFNIKLFSDSTANFFKSLFKDTIVNREKNNIVRPDMIHLLMQAKKGKLVHEEKPTKEVDAGFATVDESAVGTKAHNRDWSDDDLIAQTILFFLAGFETVSTGMTFALYEMAVNPEAQERLAKEIKENEIRNGGKFDFNSIQTMVYMDMVVSETLRLYSPALAMDRLCTKDYNLGKPNDKAEKDYIMRKGDGLQIPSWAIHRDARYFPNPLKFDPERFSEENKHKIIPFSYMPFGLGPRNCIGSRFALCEVKVMLYQVLQHFVVEPCEKTCIPPEFQPGKFNLILKGGNWIRLRIRQ